MLGIDMTTISRFENASEQLIQRVLHPDEIIEFESSENKSYFLAAHWAIKEALFKTNNSLGEFNKIRIVKKERKYMYGGYIISTSSEGDLYIAIAMKESK